jgi:hypothetical protein
MHMPTFRAEASLYKTSTHYRLATGRAGAALRVVPQQVCDDVCLDDCNFDCVGACDDPDTRGQCLTDCRAGCHRRCCPPCPTTCGPCSQTCTDCKGNVTTRSC